MGNAIIPIVIRKKIIPINIIGSRGPGPKTHTITFGSGTSFQYTLDTFSFTIKNCTFFNASGQEISVAYTITDKLYIDSNINLLNHKVIIS